MMSQKLLRYFGLWAMIGAITGAVSVLIWNRGTDRSLIPLVLLCFVVSLVMALLIGLFRKLILGKSYFPPLPK